MFVSTYASRHDSAEFFFFFLNKYISAYTYCGIGATVTHVKISLTCDLEIQPI